MHAHSLGRSVEDEQLRDHGGQPSQQRLFHGFCLEAALDASAGAGVECRHAQQARLVPGREGVCRGAGVGVDADPSALDIAVAIAIAIALTIDTAARISTCPLSGAGTSVATASTAAWTAICRRFGAVACVGQPASEFPSIELPSELQTVLYELPSRNGGGDEA